MKVILDCPFEQRNQVKALGARWDPAIKKWYVVDPPDLAPFAPWLPGDVADFVDRPVAGETKATPKPARSAASKKPQQPRRQSAPPPALPVLSPWLPAQAATDDDGPPWD
ncbi:DUF5710 domain-containing protein [Azohydromonas australica]|uniref:DUF5710 domain-containing protein n=1 Tax=Azohydromonas australica TaxID=364039 RepID=UPI0005BB8876|nr:DUF5710 domain-containing protein [Azohydromonas australica]